MGAPASQHPDKQTPHQEIGKGWMPTRGTCPRIMEAWHQDGIVRYHCWRFWYQICRQRECTTSYWSHPKTLQGEGRQKRQKILWDRFKMALQRYSSLCWGINVKLYQEFLDQAKTPPMQTAAPTTQIQISSIWWHETVQRQDSFSTINKRKNKICWRNCWSNLVLCSMHRSYACHHAQLHRIRSKTRNHRHT